MEQKIKSLEEEYKGLNLDIIEKDKIIADFLQAMNEIYRVHEVTSNIINLF